MKKLSVLLLSLASAYAAADNTQGFYVGGGLGLLQFKDGSAFDSDMNDVDFNVVEILGGYKYNSALGLELRVGTNFAKRETMTEVAGETVESELAVDEYYSVYYRPELANEEAKLYGLIGYTELTRSISTEGADEKISDSESGFSYGVGVGFVINEKSNLNFEYRRSNERNDFETGTASANIDYRF